MSGCAQREASDAQRAVKLTTHSADSLRVAVSPTAMIDALHQELDSCNVGRYPSEPPGTPAKRKSTWATGAIRSIGRVSMFVPDSARLTVSDTTRGAFGFAFRDCPGCGFNVSVDRDTTGKGIDGLVAELIAEQRAVDSANKDPKRLAYEFDVIDGPPRPIEVGGERAYFIDDDCGDCVEARIVLGRPGYIATVHLSTGDDTPMVARHTCEMMALGRTFRWRD
jgi:hypothetical protein